MKVLVITGDSRGIGKAIAERFHNKGWKVIGISRSEGNFKWEHIVGDISKVETWKIVREKVKQFGKVDVFIHNAGIHEKKKIFDLSIEEFEKVVKVNYISAFYGVKYLLDFFPKTPESNIIFISSIVVYKGSGTGGVAYVSSKAALIGLARQLAIELEPIRVNVIAPGYIDTEMIKHWDENRRKSVIEKVPLHRLGKAEDIAEVVECLIERMKYVNGEVIHVNGVLVFGD